MEDTDPDEQEPDTDPDEREADADPDPDERESDTSPDPERATSRDSSSTRRRKAAIATTPSAVAPLRQSGTKTDPNARTTRSDSGESVDAEETDPEKRGSDRDPDPEERKSETDPDPEERKSDAGPDPDRRESDANPDEEELDTNPGAGERESVADPGEREPSANGTDTPDEEETGGWTPERRRLARAGVRLLGVVLFLVVVAPFVMYAVPQVAGADASYVVLSGSMEPTISAGDAILVGGVAPEAVERGDVITFVREGDTRPTTHRVIDVVEQNGEVAFRTKGDANEEPDRQLVTPGQLRGKVISIGGYLVVLPYIGYVVTFANTPIGFVTLLVVPVVLLVGLEIRGLVSTIRAGSDGDPAGADRDTTNDPQKTTGAVETRGTARSEDAAQDSGGMTVTELKSGLVILGALVAYSAWVAYATLETWAIAAAVGSTAAFLVLTGLYLVSTYRRGGATDGTPERTGTEDGVGSVGASESIEHADGAAVKPAVGTGPVEFARGVAKPDAVPGEDGSRGESDD